jgi:DNA-cytosine methyltransferase
MAPKGTVKSKTKEHAAKPKAKLHTATPNTTQHTAKPKAKQHTSKPKAKTAKQQASHKKPASNILPSEVPLGALTTSSLPQPRERNNVRIASDCSGWCTEFLVAMSLVACPLVHLFASDSCPSVRKLITKFHCPLYLYTDIVTRNGKKPPGDCDIYVAGFPCQPFSLQGLMQGPADESGRGTIIYHVLRYIMDYLPCSFILENVAGLVTAFPEFLRDILKCVRGFCNPAGDALYEVHWRMLDTIREGGLPQHRPRIYIVGMLRAKMSKPFVWPGPASRIRPFSEVLDSDRGNIDSVQSMTTTKKNNVINGMSKLMDLGMDPIATEAIIDIGGSKPGVMVNKCPCLTRTRCSDMAYYSTKRMRELTIIELMRLQGCSPELFEDWESLLSQRQMGAIIGNSMTLSVMHRVMRSICISINIKVNKLDPWE